MSKQRRHLATPWPWIALGLFVLVITPYLVWRHVNHWPTAEHCREYEQYAVYRMNLGDYVPNIVLTMNPVLCPLLAVGRPGRRDATESAAQCIFQPLFLV